MAYLGHSTACAGDNKVVFAAVESARRVSVPEDALSRLLAYAIDNQAGANHIAHMIAILIRVKEAGLPFESFSDKITEGLGKQVDLQKLENGLNQHLDDYMFVRQLLGNRYARLRQNSGAELTSLVESLELGISRQELGILFSQATVASPAMLAVAAKNKAFLKQIAFDSSLTDEILFAGLAHESLTPQWAAFFRIAAAARKKNIPDKRIAEVAQNVLTKKGDLQQVLKELGFTSRDLRHGPHMTSPPDSKEQN